ncbi:MAG TPA: glycoside hydrolase family 3 protein, partial [Bacteroidales bacterium]|nr:glycoside hydrolase family 3 protein [Bacteroidales bacterium]
MKTLKNYLLPAVILLLLTVGGCGRKWAEENKGSFSIIRNENGQTLGFSPASGIEILTVKGLAFKDLNKNGRLDPYEDWRLPVNERALDLASRMSVEQIAGLMLYSSHQSIPSAGGGFGPGATYGGKPYAESGALPGDLSDQQKKFLTEDNLRHVLITSVESPEVAAIWNNNAQAFVEGTGLGIPVNTSSDPRHGSDS